MIRSSAARSLGRFRSTLRVLVPVLVASGPLSAPVITQSGGSGSEVPTLASSAMETARAIVETAQINDVRLSPDGARVIYSVVRGSVAENHHVIELFLQSLTADGERQGAPIRIASQATNAERPSLNPQWCPDSRSFTYFSTNGRARAEGASASSDTSPSSESGTPSTGDPSLVRYDVHTRQTAVVPIHDTVAADVPNGAPKPTRPRISVVSPDYRWSPKGRFIAFTAPVDFGQQLDPRGGIQLSTRSLGRLAPRTPGLFLLDPSSGAVEQITPGNLTVFHFDWAPDEQALVIAAAPDHEGIAYNRTDLFIIERASHSMRPLVTTPGLDAQPTWSPDGRWIAFSSDFGVPLHYLGGWPAVVPAGGGDVIRLSDVDAPRVGMRVSWTPDGKAFYYGARLQMASLLIKADLVTRDVASIAPRDRFWDSQFSLSADARRVVFTRSTLETIPQLFIRDLPSASVRRLTELTSDVPLDALVSVDRVSWESTDKRFTVHGILLTPRTAWRGEGSARSPVSRLPTVVYNEGGPSMVPTSFGEVLTSFLPFLATRGYAVFAPNTRGRDGYGLAFHRGIRDGESTGRLPYEDMMAGVEHLVQRGIADPARLGVYGHSFGGYLTAYTITQTNRFRAAVVYEGHAEELFTEAMISPPGSDWDILARDIHGIHTPFGKARERLLAESPVFNMDRVTTPTLLMYGARDSSDAVRPGARQFGSLQRFQVPSEYVLYDEGHAIRRPAALVDALMRVLAWFDRWVLGAPYQPQKPATTPEGPRKDGEFAQAW